MNEQIKYYEQKLAFEMDSADVFEALENQENIIIVDTRKESAYKQEHIPQAINFPHREMNSTTVTELDKDIIYVCYCDGIGCNASTKGALKLAKLGFQTRELIGGIQWWKSDGYATNGEVSQKGTIVQCAC